MRVLALPLELSALLGTIPAVSRFYNAIALVDSAAPFRGRSVSDTPRGLGEQLVSLTTIYSKLVTVREPEYSLVLWESFICSKLHALTVI